VAVNVAKLPDLSHKRSTDSDSGDVKALGGRHVRMAAIKKLTSFSVCLQCVFAFTTSKWLTG
jgi:hypothetical protein